MLLMSCAVIDVIRVIDVNYVIVVIGVIEVF